MNREKDELIPFQEGVNINLFFPGAQRREILDEIKKSIDDGVAVLSIIGNEGTGKTMLCRMVEQELSDRFICVYLPETLESFDEVIRILAREAGVDDTNSFESIEEIVSAVSDNLKKRGQHLVVIFDQAERMYLAMLERLRKLLDRINAHENQLQLIFAGRKVLLENLDQLAICDFADAAETHFYLDDLDASETYAYLNHCARQRSRAKGKSIFTPEASKKIFNIARGNLKTTNILAATSIESADNEGSFVVTPRNVNIKDAGLEGFQESFLTGVRRRSGWLLSGALLLVLCILLVVIFLGGDEEEQISEQRPEKTLEISAEKKREAEMVSTLQSSSTGQVDMDVQKNPVAGSKINESSIVFTTEAEDQAEQLKNKQLTDARQETDPSPAAQQASSQGVQTSSSLDNDTTSKMATSLKNTLENKDTYLQREEVSGAGFDKTAVETKEKLSEPMADERGQIIKELPQGKIAEPSTTDSQVKVSELSVREEVDSALFTEQKREEQGVVSIPEQIKKQEKKILLAAGKQQEEEQMVSKVLAGTKKSAPNHQQNITAPKQVFKVAKVKLPGSGAAVLGKDGQQPTMSAGNLYEQRIAAGKALFSGKIKGTQTIQIMALTGEQAEKNLRERFSTQQYKEVADSLYILGNKNGSTLFVYYGAFPDRESANRALEQLPPFLGKNEPYVISLLEAQSKITP